MVDFTTLPLRPATQEDAASLLDLLKILEGETPYFPWLPGERSLTLEGLEEQIAATNEGDRAILIADLDGEVAGYLDIHRSRLQRLAQGASLEIGVRKSHWGCGLGRTMMQSAERWARGKGIRRIAFPVVSENLRAIGLYLRMGYTVEGCRRQVYRIDDRLVDEYMLAKLLESGVEAPPRTS